MERRPLLAGNWKMHTTVAEAEELALAIAGTPIPADRDVMVAPPFTALAAVRRIVADSAVLLGAQNVCWEEKGAFTGEISPPMLKDLGCTLVIVGHSERRHVFGESDAMINRRATGALRHGLIPVLCIGETLAERESGQTFQVLELQLLGGLRGIPPAEAERMVIAYEPVWAIGTGKTASVDQAQEVHFFVRGLLAEMYEKNIATQIRILYGGSVNPENIDALMSQDDVDGALVGGAALKAESFRRIINYKR
ncbi:MAG: triose-phosphate isomerase [Deltaproteobacteria bacterium]|nr:triose-phosphate isomerase [Deltaproteobacteria bacterium]